MELSPWHVVAGFAVAGALACYAVLHKAKAARTDKHIMGGDVLSHSPGPGAGEGASGQP